MKRIAFVFDRVAHYHRALFGNLESRLGRRGIELHLFSGRKPSGATGRVGLEEQVVANEGKYDLSERKFGPFTFCIATGYIDGIRELSPDIVVCPAHPGDIGHWTLARRKKRDGYKLVSWLCGYEPNPGRMKDFLVSRFIRKFDYHLAYHSNARDYAIHYGAPSGNVSVIHNTIDESAIEVIDAGRASEIVRAKHPEIGDRPIVLFVGAVLKEKNLEIVAEAMRIRNGSDAVLLVVGDGPWLPELRTAMGERSDVVFAGEVIDGVGPYFDAAEVYVMPGTGGLGMNEAMAHSLPIIVGEADGSADDLVVDGENGFRLREGSPEELARHLSTILNDPDLSARMGRVGRERITGKFSFERFLDRIEDRLTDLL